MRKMSESDFTNMVTFFDRMAQTNWLSAVHGRLKEWSGDWSGKSVLDVGCGTARLLMRGTGACRIKAIQKRSKRIRDSKSTCCGVCLKSFVNDLSW